MIKLRSCRHVLHNAQVGVNLTYSYSRMNAQHPRDINLLNPQACDAMAGILSRYSTRRLQQAHTASHSKLAVQSKDRQARKQSSLARNKTVSERISCLTMAQKGRWSPLPEHCQRQSGLSEALLRLH